MNSTFYRGWSLACLFVLVGAGRSFADDEVPEAPREPTLSADGARDDSTGEGSPSPSAAEAADLPLGAPTPDAEALKTPDIEKGVRVLVRRFEGDGSLTPLPGVEVRRERYKKLGGMEGGTELIEVLSGQTGPGGAVVFPVSGPPGVAESDSYVATWAGLEWEVATTEGASEFTATVFPLTTKTDAFRMGLQAFVELRDSNFLVQQQYTLVNDSFEAIDFSGGEGLRIPLLIHDVFGQPLNVGYLPTRTDSKRTRFDIKPRRGRLTVERGTLIFRGIVPPGRGVQVLASFAIPYAEEDSHVLSLSAPYDLDDVRVAVVAPDRSGLKAALVAPHRAAPRTTAGAEELWLIPLESPKAGQPLQLILDHTPDRRAVTRNIATALGGAVLFVISAIFFATRRRRKAA